MEKGDLIISNNLIGKMPILDETIIRINLAWIKSRLKAQMIIEDCKYEIYLDFPSGRTKPPVPVITLQEALELAQHPKVKYFAYSNAESIKFYEEIERSLPNKIIVPKIETAVGVRLIPDLIKAGATHVMADLEDLFSSVHGNVETYQNLVDELMSYKDQIKILRLQGVVFNEE